MQVVRFKEADSYEPEEGWYRVSLARGGSISVEYYEKPPGHSSPMHKHKNKQISIVLKGEMKAYTENEEIVLKEFDSVFFEEDEPHRIENVGREKAIGIDIFVPGRPFDFWVKRNKQSQVESLKVL